LEEFVGGNEDAAGGRRREKRVDGGLEVEGQEEVDSCIVGVVREQGIREA